MQTTDPGLLFQSTDQLVAESNRDRKRAAAKSVGRPVELSGKVIDLLICGQDAYVAESGWQARQVSLETGKTLRVFRGHKGPVTSVAIYRPTSVTSVQGNILFTGSWDKTIMLWDTVTGKHLHTLAGHTDFIKSLTIVDDCLVSTSSDKTIRVWDISPLSENRMPVHSETLKEHTRPVDCAVSAQLEDKTGWMTILWTGDSMGVIHEWQLKEKHLVHRRVLPGHETSVGSLVPVEDGLWSVSMDKTAILHSHDPGQSLVVPHEAYVHSVFPVPTILSPRNLVITGAEDDICVWEVDDGSKEVKLVSTVKAHSGSVTAIKLWAPDDTPKNWRVVTGSLDGSCRRWTLDELLQPPRLDFAPSSSDEPNFDLTEEEERELAELMGDDD